MKKILKKIDPFIALFLLFSFICSVFYLFQINFSTDLIILFLAEKLYLGHWLARGILPLFNPTMYAGIPFLFDVGMGHLHPFTLFCVLPYPFSFSVWIFASFSLLLVGFYLFFKQFTKTTIFAFLLTLIFFFSGSGYWRVNNPTIFLVIAHFGFLFWSLSQLKTKSFSPLFIVMGILTALAGHVQFVLYGFILVIALGVLVYKIEWKRMFLHLFIIGFCVSWYFILSIPLVLHSTRITSDADYISMGRLPIQQLVEFVLPLFFGYVHNGSSWNVGPIFVILISSLFSLFVAISLLKNKIRAIWFDVAILALVLVSSFGFVNFPFFRAPSQALILFHIWGLLFIARNEKVIVATFFKCTKRSVALFGCIVSLAAFLFFSTSLFTTLFIKGYTILKHRPPNLFFDLATIEAIGKLVGINFIIYIVFFVLLFALSFTKKKQLCMIALIVFVIFEGLFVNFFHNYFIPQSVLTKLYPLPLELQTQDYRVQTGADVIPYFGFHTYMGSVLFRPPFSKEPTVVTPQEEKNHEYLANIMSYYPSTWSMTYGLQAVQGYNTFVTKEIADYFKTPSPDYLNVYSYIVKRNNLFGKSEKGLAINGIETSKVTLMDPRWEKLGVKYFISDRPLSKYKLLEQSNGRYIYEDEYTLPLYRIVDGDTIATKHPDSTDPNGWRFTVTKDDVGKELQVSINPGGFVAKLNGQEIPVRKEQFLIRILLNGTGMLTVNYSPLRHLQETIETSLHLQKK